MQGGEETVHWHPILSPKEEIVRTVSCHCGACAIVGGQQFRQVFRPAGFLILR